MTTKEAFTRLKRIYNDFDGTVDDCLALSMAMKALKREDDLDSAYAHGYTQAEAKFRAMIPERKKRTWIRTTNPSPVWVCSNCRNSINQIVGDDFCRFCGARMDGEEHE